MKKYILIFAAGQPHPSQGGGSGFRNLIKSYQHANSRIEIIGVVCNHADGSIRKIAEEYGIPFIHMPGPYTAEAYQNIYKTFTIKYGEVFVALSGWLKKVLGLPRGKVFNIHPGPLPFTGGKGMYGHFVHEKVLGLYQKRMLSFSKATMHYIDDNFDTGEIIHEQIIPVYAGDTADTLGKRVNEAEHAIQPIITHLIVHGHIKLGKYGITYDATAIATLRNLYRKELDKLQLKFF